ncbi:hypothetical protein AB0368_07185 [Actinoplanes sp. NPDC051475]|uniref:hypothetical protein n=1 Tax=Actinoplanes sp. NPDC051475 TaxID=3157225 RepID=UPI00344C4539
MTARVLFDGSVFLSYHQVQLCDEAYDESDDEKQPWRGQVNGLCGAASAGRLDLFTGLHTGDVQFRVELHDTEPVIDGRWEEVVEASFVARTDSSFLAGLMSDGWSIDLPAGSYRVRYCADKMQQGDDQDSGADEIIDSYLLQFWPAQPAPDRIVRRTSRAAAYWHDHNPEPALTASDLAVRTQREREAAEKEDAEYQRLMDQEVWGDRIPSDRLRAAAESANPLQELDPELPHLLAEQDGDVLKAVALWAAERAAAVSSIDQLPWVVAALAALRKGEPLPPPFDHEAPEDDYPTEVWAQLDAIEITTIRMPSVVNGPEAPEISLQHVAMPAVLANADRDPLTAALNAVYASALAHGEAGYRAFLAELKSTFPQVQR